MKPRRTDGGTEMTHRCRNGSTRSEAVRSFWGSPFLLLSAPLIEARSPCSKEHEEETNVTERVQNRLHENKSEEFWRIFKDKSLEKFIGVIRGPKTRCLLSGTQQWQFLWLLKVVMKRNDVLCVPLAQCELHLRTSRLNFCFYTNLHSCWSSLDQIHSWSYFFYCLLAKFTPVIAWFSRFLANYCFERPSYSGATKHGNHGVYIEKWRYKYIWKVLKFENIPP